MITSKQVKVARQSLGLTQSVVSGETGISRSYLSQFENGQLALDKSAIEKIKMFFEQKGFDFGGSNSQAEKAEKVEKAASELEGRLVEKMGKGAETVPVDVEDLSELVGLLGDYVTLTASPAVEDEVTFDLMPVSPEIFGQEGIQSLIDTVELGEAAIRENFRADCDGKTESGFWSGTRSERAGKLISAMAVQYIRMMALKTGKLLVPLDSLNSLGVFSGEFGKDAKAVAERLQYNLSGEKPELDNQFKNVVEAA
ncbi:hypothetical protein C9J03_26220 [Photobacterium gaetbulicola]|uniref:helix-turn-helix domain-containing protein n=1 Tax=Photobacterium gaetbulicola TaxID=1295392 RepID=UPI000D16A774|nr:helix-turn-helix transcriptional regulator [Photobacterium gaetbulicola]PST98534.1 hypothetical protein C9J03_26220 [Photobacterium gaetbulicola]